METHTNTAATAVDHTRLERKLLADDAGAAWALVRTDGHIVSCNEVFAQLYAERPSEELHGRSLGEFLPIEAARERIGYFRAAAEQARTVTIHELWGGVWMIGVVRPAPAADAHKGNGPLGGEVGRDAGRDGGRLVNFTLRFFDGLTSAGALGEDDPTVLTPRHTNLGPLSRLTSRELEVLAYIGEGCTNHEIAKRIFRSDKTVEWHRSQLGIKLGVNTRVELARMAYRAGLDRWAVPARPAMEAHGSMPGRDAGAGTSANGRASGVGAGVGASGPGGRAE